MEILKRNRTSLSDEPRSPFDKAVSYYEENRAHLVHIARKNGAPDPEAAVQSAMVTIMENADEIIDRNIPSFVQTQVKWKSIDGYRYERRRPTDSLDLELNVSSTIDPAEEAITSVLLFEGLSRISKEKREAVMLVHLADKEYSEAARHARVRVGTMKSRASRGVEGMRAVLNGNNHLHETTFVTTYGMDDSEDVPQQ
jgi:DNA-directed RNA polymerase specialized sigma24 family protein